MTNKRFDAPRRVDGNQAEIVAALRKVGCEVFITARIGRGFPDLVVSRAGINYLLEVKAEDERLTPSEQKFANRWRGHYCIVRTVEQALKAVEL